MKHSSLLAALYVITFILAANTASYAKNDGNDHKVSDTISLRLNPGHFILEPEQNLIHLDKRQGVVSYDVSLYGSGATHGMPFWGATNRRGLMPEALSSGGNRFLSGMENNPGGGSGLMTAGVEFAYLTRPGIVITSGISLAGYGVTGSWKGMIDRLHFGISWRKLHLDLGMKDRIFDMGLSGYRSKGTDVDIAGEFNGLSLTGGDMMYTGNVRNLPGYNLSTDFIYIPWTRKILAFKANFADYMMIDNRYSDKTLLHNEALFLKISPIRQLSLTLGVEMWSQWSGTSPVYGKQPSTFDDYLRVVFGKNGGEDATESDQINVLGNHLGRELIRIDWTTENFILTFQHDIPFDDRSGMRFQNFPDGANTLNFSFRDRDKWVTDLLFEFISTKSQSGPSHNDPDNPEIVLGGNDNYFNNGEYRSAWTYYGRTIGLPLFTPMPITENSNGQVWGVCNNRITAYHFGIRGKAARKIPYKFMFTYSRNFGQYSQRLQMFNSVPEQFSLALECEVPHLTMRLPLSLGVGLYGDFGQMYQDSFGVTVRLSYMGRTRFGK